MAGPLLDPEQRLLCFAPHPDDETIGAGGQLPLLRNAWIVGATDGAPANMADARAHGFTAREEYARARRDELLAAMAIAGIGPERVLMLGFVDQECARQLAELAQRVAAVIEERQPDTVLAPPYEGGHPDHDSLAFAVHMACRDLALRHRRVPRIVEYPLYHSRSGQMTTGEFLPPADAGVITIHLSASAADLKTRMLECFVTQRAVLQPFQSVHERFRVAPRYDFGAPPHPGTLHYENFDWGVTGSQWRDLAREAARTLGVESC